MHFFFMSKDRASFFGHGTLGLGLQRDLKEKERKFFRTYEKITVVIQKLKKGKTLPRKNLLVQTNKSSQWANFNPTIARL